MWTNDITYPSEEAIQLHVYKTLEICHVQMVCTLDYTELSCWINSRTFLERTTSQCAYTMYYEEKEAQTK